MSTVLDLEWRGTGYDPARFFIKGTELATAFYGPNKRFLICETRTIEADGFSGICYTVRDAYTVSDADVQNGVQSRIVGNFDSVEEAIEYCDRQ